jgi:hypothetical protein
MTQDSAEVMLGKAYLLRISLLKEAEVELRLIAARIQHLAEHKVMMTGHPSYQLKEHFYKAAEDVNQLARFTRNEFENQMGQVAYEQVEELERVRNRELEAMAKELIKK